MSGLFQQHEQQDIAQGDLRLVRVALHRGIERTRGAGDLRDALLSYRLPAGASPVVGQIVQVPLGKGNKPATGVVIAVGGAEFLDGLPASKVKPLLGVTSTVLTPGLLELAKWMAGYYVCPLGMVLHAVLPAAVKRQVGRKLVTVVKLVDGAEVPPVMPKRLAKVWDPVQTLLQDAQRVRSDDGLGLPSLNQLCSEVQGATPAAIKKLADLGLLRLEQREEIHARGAAENLGVASDAGQEAPHAVSGGQQARSFTLTPEQEIAVAGITPRLGTFSVHLLLGVTGSGKTEVYLRLIEAMLAGDPVAGAIVLVPEIALTPQTSGRFIERFGETVAVLHSGLSASQRSAQWAAVARGRVRVVVGARSAIFAPLAKVGMIVVDEEHDSSYKQDQLPRYHARDVAIKRAQLEGCVVVLGSATPSLESYANAACESGGKYALWRLPGRATGARMPRVEIVDLAEERRLRAQRNPQGWRDRQLHLLGPTLESAIEQTLNAGGQTMLLLNRRGYANYLCCPDPKCGWVMHCDHCDAASVYHLHSTQMASTTPGFVRCHHCLAELLLPKLCPVCRKSVNTFGLGTQRVEEELQRKFHHTHGLTLGETMLRLDSDTMHSAADYFSALDRFARGEVKMLVGTQMIAKGLDFPNVRLVGIVSADTSLNMPDFRAAERTFQLVAQVAGRAGRGSLPGRVVVQTMSPAEPSIVLASRHDFEGFAARELEIRRSAGLPPIGKMARIVCRDEDLAKATASAAEIAHALHELAKRDASDLRIRGPMPCPISRIADHHRIAIEVLSMRRGTIQSAFAELRSRGLLISDANTAVDVDPVALL